MSRLGFFQRVKQQHGVLMFREVCRNLQYQSAEAGRTIININNEGKTFYVILKGKVTVNIYLPIHDGEEGEFHQEVVNILGVG